MAKKMYIYLKKSDELEKNILKLNNKADWAANELFGKTVNDYQLNPHIITDEDFYLLNANPVFKPLFLKATSISFPKFDKLIGQSVLCRSYGTYHFGKAVAELTPANGDEKARYWLKIETNEWEGIADMKELQKRLWAGTISPTVLYDKEQRKLSAFQVLAEILSLHKLSPLKRFLLALRLTKVN